MAMSAISGPDYRTDETERAGAALVVDPAVLHGLSEDQAEWAEVGRAEIAVRARSEAEVAATVRVGHEVGRGNAAAARRAGFVAIALCIAFMATMTLLVALTRHQLPLLFLGNQAPDPQTIAIAAPCC